MIIEHGKICDEYFQYEAVFKNSHGKLLKNKKINQIGVNK